MLPLQRRHTRPLLPLLLFLRLLLSWLRWLLPLWGRRTPLRRDLRREPPLLLLLLLIAQAAHLLQLLRSGDPQLAPTWQP